MRQYSWLFLLDGGRLEALRGRKLSAGLSAEPSPPPAPPSLRVDRSMPAVWQRHGAGWSFASIGWSERRGRDLGARLGGYWLEGGRWCEGGTEGAAGSFSTSAAAAIL